MFALALISASLVPGSNGAKLFCKLLDTMNVKKKGTQKIKIEGIIWPEDKLDKHLDNYNEMCDGLGWSNPSDIFNQVYYQTDSDLSKVGLSQEYKDGLIAHYNLHGPYYSEYDKNGDPKTKEEAFDYCRENDLIRVFVPQGHEDLTDSKARTMVVVLQKDLKLCHSLTSPEIQLWRLPGEEIYEHGSLKRGAPVEILEHLTLRSERGRRRCVVPGQTGKVLRVLSGEAIVKLDEGFLTKPEDSEPIRVPIEAMKVLLDMHLYKCGDCMDWKDSKFPWDQDGIVQVKVECKLNDWHLKDQKKKIAEMTIFDDRWDSSEGVAAGKR